jgi:DNA polymerase epsilon subunit 1
LLNRDDKTTQPRISEFFNTTATDISNSETLQSRSQANIQDIEDFGGHNLNKTTFGGKRRAGSAFVISKKKPKKILKVNIPEILIDPYFDYCGWLSQRKKVWLDRINARERESGGGTGIKSFFISKNRKINRCIWQILNVVETDTAGVFRVWAIIEGVLESMTFDVPRILYFNSRVPPKNIEHPEIQMSKVMRNLPRNRPSLYLYELKMSETFYRTNASMFSSLFNHSETEGVYESQVTPLFRALLHIGCFGELKIKDEVDVTECLQLEQLVRNTSPLQLRRYLSRGSFKCLHLYRAKAGARQIWGLFIQHTAIMHVFLVDPGINRDALPNFKRIYTEILESENIISDTTSNFPETVEFRSAISDNENEAIKSINKIILDIKDEGNQPIMLGIQAAGGSLHLRSIGLMSIREFPNLPIRILYLT